MRIEELKEKYPLVYDLAARNYFEQLGHHHLPYSSINDFIWSDTTQNPVLWSSLYSNHIAEAKRCHPELFVPVEGKYKHCKIITNGLQG